MSALMAWSTLAVADFEADAPNTAIAETRARPTMSADAVCAVRRGLRIEFSRPSLPGAPSTRASGRPITLESGRATAGASMVAPTKMTAAPAPTSAMAGAESPTATQDGTYYENGRAPEEPAPVRHAAGLLPVGDSGHRGDADGSPGRANGRNNGHPDPYGEATRARYGPRTRAALLEGLRRSRSAAPRARWRSARRARSR